MKPYPTRFFKLPHNNYYRKLLILSNKLYKFAHELKPSPAELLKQYFEKRAALDHEIDKTLSEIQKILGIDVKSCN